MQDDESNQPPDSEASAAPAPTSLPAVAKTEASTEEDPGAAAAAAPPPQAPPSASRRRPDWFARMLALLALLGLSALPVLGWYYGHPLLVAREERLQALEAAMAAEEPAPDTEAQIAQAVSASVTPLRRQLDEVAQQLGAEAGKQRAALVAAESALSERLRREEERFLRLEERLSRLTATDRRAWLLAESAFMVRLAGQRLAAAQDVDSALALLRTADDLLLEADDPLLDRARRAIAEDVAALRALPAVDVIGIDARLNALLTQTDTLVLMEAEPDPAPRSEGTWRERAAAGWQAALAALSDYLVIRKRSDDFAALLTPEWQTLARQNLRMLIEQAQIALLSGNAELYQRALERATGFAELFAANDPVRIKPILKELSALREEEIARPLPDLLTSRRALSDATRQLAPAAEG